MVERASDADLAAVGVEAEELVLVARQNAVLDTYKQRDNTERVLLCFRCGFEWTGRTAPGLERRAVSALDVNPLKTDSRAEKDARGSRSRDVRRDPRLTPAYAKFLTRCDQRNSSSSRSLAQRKQTVGAEAASGLAQQFAQS